MPANILVGTALHNLGTADTALTTGITADASELNIMDGVTATTAEINAVADISSQAAIAGGYIECVDYKAGFWSCRAFTQSGGGSEATPFSASVS